MATEAYSNLKLNAILSSAAAGRPLSRAEVRFLLGLRCAEDRQRLFHAARELRRHNFGNRIFLYGFLYFSTYCRNDCHFCHYRCSNTTVARYRKPTDEILESALEMAAAGVHLIDLTMGEDPLFFQENRKGIARLAELVAEVKSATGLPVMVSPGVLPEFALAHLAAAGADWYACYQETHSPTLFAKLRVDQDYNQRLSAKRDAKCHGLLIEEGLLSGVGESLDDIAESIKMMRDLDADQIRVMNFVPQDNTPMAQRQAPDIERELSIIATLRIAFPDRLIPASLDVDGLDGLQQRLNAGANVVTSLVPPGSGLAGVANSELDIEDARRTPAKVKPILERCGLQAATANDYRDWVRERKQQMNPCESTHQATG